MVRKQIALITGATSGVGFAGAEELALHGWDVIVHGRSKDSASSASNYLHSRVPGANFSYVYGDLSSLLAVRTIIPQVLEITDAIDLLWNNAGLTVPNAQVSADGVDLQMAVNHLAPFTLSHLLIPMLAKRTESRIIFTGSYAYKQSSLPFSDWLSPLRASTYRSRAIYCQSKLANILVSNELAQRLSALNITSNVFDPGFVKSQFVKGIMRLGQVLAVSAKQGASTGVLLADSKGLAGITGTYWSNQKIEPITAFDVPKLASEIYATSMGKVNAVLGTDWNPLAR